MNNILTSNNNFTSGSLLPVHKVSLHSTNMLSISFITTPFWAMIYPRLRWGMGGHKYSRSKKGRFSTLWPISSFPTFVFQAFLTWTLHFTYTDLLTLQESRTSAPSSLEPPSGITTSPLHIYYNVTAHLSHKIQLSSYIHYTESFKYCKLSLFRFSFIQIACHILTYLYLLCQQFDYERSVPP